MTAWTVTWVDCYASKVTAVDEPSGSLFPQTIWLALTLMPVSIQRSAAQNHNSEYYHFVAWETLQCFPTFFDFSMDAASTIDADSRRDTYQTYTLMTSYRGRASERRAAHHVCHATSESAPHCSVLDSQQSVLGRPHRRPSVDPTPTLACWYSALSAATVASPARSS
jgi:hypothetical protein